MANTSRKRPAPPTTNNNSQSSNVNLPSGIDTLLAKYAKHLKPGQSISVQLIKGPVSSSVDPIAARKAATKAARALASSQSSNNNSGVSSGNDTDNDTTNTQPSTVTTVGKGINAPLNFPRLAKFSETVTPPDFIKKLKDGRMYEEEEPLAKVCYLFSVCCVVDSCVSLYVHILCVFLLGYFCTLIKSELRIEKEKNARYVISSKCEVILSIITTYNHLVLDCSRCYIKVITYGG